jgi:hypothetical protein
MAESRLCVDAFERGDLPAFVAALGSAKSTSFLSNAPSPISCRAARRGMVDFIRGAPPSAPPLLPSPRGRRAARAGL